MLVVAGPQALEHRQHLLHVGDPLVLVHASHHAVELTLIGAAADTELHPSTRHEIEQADLSGHLDRVPVGGLDHGDAEADPVGVGAEPRQQLEGVGRDRHLDRMVFGSPDDLESRRIGHLHHVHGVAGDIPHVDRRVVAGKIDRKTEFHGAFPLSLTPDTTRGSMPVISRWRGAPRRPSPGPQAAASPSFWRASAAPTTRPPIISMIPAAFSTSWPLLARTPRFR